MARVSELELAEEIEIEVLIDAKSMEDAVERAAGFRRRRARGQRLRIESTGNQVQFGVGQSEGRVVEVGHVRHPFVC
jgi:urease beta subunit